MSELLRSCTVRPAGGEDLLAVLWVHAQRDPGGELPSVPSRLEKETWSRMMGIDDLSIYVAEVEAVPVGTATLLLMPNITYGCNPTAFVEAVVVAHTHRRRGVATQIMRRVLTDAGKAGCNKVQLLSHKRHAQDGAHRLYTTLGFEAEAEGFRRYLRDRPAATRIAQP